MQVLNTYKFQRIHFFAFRTHNMQSSLIVYSLGKTIKRSQCYPNPLCVDRTGSRTQLHIPILIFTSASTLHDRNELIIVLDTNIKSPKLMKSKHKILFNQVHFMRTRAATFFFFSFVACSYTSLMKMESSIITRSSKTFEEKMKNKENNLLLW